MNKTAVKNYAIWARRELIEKVSAKAAYYGITADAIVDANAESIEGRLLTEVERMQRQALLGMINAEGFEKIMEEVAYIWFNRFAALRFMEVNGYLPSHVRVFTNEEGEFKPQILSEAIHLDLNGLNKDKVYELKNANKDEELFKYLLITQCNALNSILPGMFQKIEDYTELLLPDNLLRKGSVLDRMITDIPEDNFDVNSEDGQVEIIGWLYQYYIYEKHQEVIDPLHGKVIRKEEIPAATQLFTTDWVVRYLIDNSVGRYWIERNPDSALAEQLTYYVKPKGGGIEMVDESITPQDVTIFDPCVGSGHFLIYAFDVLIKIYIEYGYSEQDAVGEIVKNNLFGLDIDGRASQLAYFSVMMKARQHDRRFLTRGIQPHIFEIVESNNIDKNSIKYFCDNNNALKVNVEEVLRAMENAKEYGSILQIPAVDFDNINKRFCELEDDISIYDSYWRGDFRTLIWSAELMSRQYAIVATNPPYLNKYAPQLKDYIYRNYKKYKGDLFSVFIYRNIRYCIPGGYSGFMTPMVWMFIKTYEELRNYIIKEKSIETLIQFEYSAFEEATVPICSFVLQNKKSDKPGCYFRLSAFRGGMDVQKQKVLEALSKEQCAYYYESEQLNYLRIPGSPIAYWVSHNFIEAFNYNNISQYAEVITGMTIGDNNAYLRLWWEVDMHRVALNKKTMEEVDIDRSCWIPYSKGGPRRNWYGNYEYLVNWSKKDSFNRSKTTLKHLYLKEAVTWPFVTSGDFSARILPTGFLWDVAGSPCFFRDKRMEYYILGAMCSKVINYILKVTNPTINVQSIDVANIPIIVREDTVETVNKLVQQCICISKDDWDSFETSWDFKKDPLVGTHIKIEDAYNQWKEKCERRFQIIKNNEEDLNRLFINIYGLQEDLTNDVIDKNVTVHRIVDTNDDKEKETTGGGYSLTKQDAIKSLISYAVGCLLGRYSLDVSGIAYAGGEWDDSKYRTFQPDKDDIIPICDDEYFDDDIVGRFVKFIEIVYGEETLEENLRFIADALGGSGTSREIIRKYFINDFYKDHCKTYQKRPIYWLFDSGKKNGFKCLIYMHRYQPDTIARIRTDYVHEQQARYRTTIEDIESRIDNVEASERTKLNRQLTKVQAQAKELHVYEEKIHHLADQMISIDLDDGVKHNYELFKDVLKKI